MAASQGAESAGNRRQRYIYGPVPSRRLGQSLGVDPIPFKTCNFNCVYCQLGRTAPLTNKRRDYIRSDDILTQLAEALAVHEPGMIDYVTFVGQGEPTLCASLGWLIRQVKAMTSIPVAVLTNDALLSRTDVRQDLDAADVVIPSLDAATEAMFQRINRPWPRFHIADIIAGLAAFRELSSSQVWVEVMLVKGLNDGEAELHALRDALTHIHPQRVQINVPVRPPAEPWVEIPEAEALARAVAILGESAELVAPYDGDFTLDYSCGPVEAVLTIIRRHPMREHCLKETLRRYTLEKPEAVLAELEASGQARRRSYAGEAYWEYSGVRSGRKRS